MSARPSKSSLRRKTARIVELLEAEFGTPEPGPRSSPLNSLIKTVLSQSTSDANSGRAYASLRRTFPAWRQALDASVDELAEAIRSGGLANQKSVRIRRILKWVDATFGELSLDALHDMSVTEACDLLCAQKGIGVKTVAVTLLFACRKDVFPVDTHVHRICRRLGLVPDNASAEKTFHLMAPLVPQGKALSLHVNMLKHGRSRCRSRGPLCDGCNLRRLCRYRREMSRSDSPAGRAG